MTSEFPAKPQIHKLDKSHSTDAFNCGSAPLDVYLKRFALVNQSAGAAQTYAAVLEGEVIGYYSLSTASVEYDQAPERTKKGLARHPVPVILIARLAVDQTWQGKGLGAALLLDALRRIVSAADIVGIRAVLVHAKDEAAKRFYRHFDFDPSPVDPMHLFLLTKEIQRLIKAP
ncbi:MAG: GNAT family N-acetyltransferase [Xanthobacteraceae bacterium]|nr:GNAT family N-acetyltransferase [Xanthobacteraceae bacterium]MBX9840722.1 GNAT family N-acetyltransferase [Xanthobacteraceae bacterium]